MRHRVLCDRRERNIEPPERGGITLAMLVEVSTQEIPKPLVIQDKKTEPAPAGGTVGGSTLALGFQTILLYISVDKLLCSDYPQNFLISKEKSASSGCALENTFFWGGVLISA